MILPTPAPPALCQHCTCEQQGCVHACQLLFSLCVSEISQLSCPPPAAAENRERARELGEFVAEPPAALPAAGSRGTAGQRYSDWAAAEAQQAARQAARQAELSGAQAAEQARRAGEQAAADGRRAAEAARRRAGGYGGSAWGGRGQGRQSQRRVNDFDSDDDDMMFKL